MDTPKGNYRIDRSNVVLQLPSVPSEIVYSAEHLRTSSNRWFQAKETRHLGHRKLALGPSAIAYDHHSGNVIVAMGILGVAVGAPDGRWTPAAVDTYSPIAISNSRKVSALLSSSHFWVAVFTFPWSMIAIAIVIGGAFVKKADNVQVPGCLLFMALPCLFLSILIPTSFLGTLGGYDESPGNLSGAGIIFVPLSVAAALFAAAITWRGQWRVPWWAVAVSLVAMMAFTALPYLAWVQSGVSRGFAALAAVALCIVTTSLLAFFLVRQSPLEQDELPLGR